MIQDVTLERTRYASSRRPGSRRAPAASPTRSGLAPRWTTSAGSAWHPSRDTSTSCSAYATREIQSVPGLRLIGTAPDKASVLSFVLDGYRPEEVASALDREGIAVRAGHHCAQPILRRYGLESTVRPSLAMYNTCGEVDLLVAALRRLAADAGRGAAPGGAAGRR